MNLEKLTLEQWAAADKEAERFIRRKTAKQYDQFADVFYDDLLDVIREFEETRSQRQNDGENRMTSEICINLRRFGAYDAIHNRDASGAIDITVTHRLQGFKWIGEAKIFTSLPSLEQGFKQLTTRYSLAAPEYKTGLLAYIFRDDAKGKMRDWKERLGNASLPDLAFSDCSRRKELHFYSTHKHASSGCNFEVWHIGVALHYYPTDTSAEQTRARRKAKGQ